MRARSKFGIAMAAMIKMIATTISNSMSEKPFWFFFISITPQKFGPTVFWFGFSCFGANLVKKKGGSRASSLRRNELRLLEHQRNRCAGSRTGADGNAGQVVVDDAALIRTESALAGAARIQRSGIDFKRGERRNDRAGAGVRHIHEAVAALRTGRQDRVDQTRIGKSRCASSRGAAQVRQGWCKTLTVRGVELGVGGHDRTNRSNRRSFVSRDTGAKQVRNCDGRDDQNDRHNDQQLDE